ncbi:MAG: hypothetical protein AVDCRST_MAG88-2059 [uncultured Thermomicrobiales bacterium]|uniref:Uncharacterized protein n=1 Tax=uncultured Thermomicrobiales bacterium TaxID=1645740 RepID=A0A6J4V4I0_9BACT|nr:MAG: hypothetical protein AVDCRST_MAG88-2059 [uncultured Thermomicrobiales bacterium]
MAQGGTIDRVRTCGAAVRSPTSAGRDADRRAERARSPYSRQVAGVLAAATILSMVYTAYTAITLGTGDLRNPATYVLYGAWWALVALVRTDKRWAWRIVAGATALMLAVGIFYYPTVFVPARQTTFGWFEYAGYMGLLLLAEYLCIQRLRGVTLTQDA